MSWAKGDDLYDDKPKIRKAWRLSGYAVGLHWMAVTASCRHETDGLVDPEWLADKLAVIPAAAGRKAVKTLVDLGLYEPLPAGETREFLDSKGNHVTVGPLDEDAFIVHDYLDYNDSSITLAERRAKDAARKAKGGLASPSADSKRTPRGIQPDSGSPDPTRPDHNSSVAASGDRGAPPELRSVDVEAVWTAYTATRTAILGARSLPKFDRKRRELISRRLREWPLDDIRDAVQGWRHSPHNRGENDRNQPYCDIELILRDTKHIERFRDLHRHHSGADRLSPAELAARINAAHDDSEAA